MKNTLAKITLGILFSLLVLLPALCAPAAADASNTIELSLGRNDLVIDWTGENYTLTFTPSEDGWYSFESSGDECNPDAVFEEMICGRGGADDNFAFARELTAGESFSFELVLWDDESTYSLAVAVAKLSLAHVPGEEIALSLGSNELELHCDPFDPALYTLSFTPEEDGVYWFESFCDECDPDARVGDLIFYEWSEGNHNFRFARKLTASEPFSFELQLWGDGITTSLAVAVSKMTPPPIESSEEITLSPGFNEFTFYWTGENFTLTFTPEEDGWYRFVSSGYGCEPTAILEDPIYDDWGADFSFTRELTRGVPFSYELGLSDAESAYSLTVTVGKVQQTITISHEDENSLMLGFNDLEIDWTGDDYTLTFTPEENGVYRFESFGYECDPDAQVGNEEYSSVQNPMYYSDNFLFTRALTAGEKFSFGLKLQNGENTYSLAVCVGKVRQLLTLSHEDENSLKLGFNDFTANWTGDPYTLTFTPAEDGVYRFESADSNGLDPTVYVESDYYEGGDGSGNFAFTRWLSANESLAFELTLQQADVNEICALTVIVTKLDVPHVPGEAVELSPGPNVLELYWTDDPYTLTFTPAEDGVYRFESADSNGLDPTVYVESYYYEGEDGSGNFAFTRRLSANESLAFELMLEQADVNEICALTIIVTREYSVTVTSSGNGTAGADAETSASGKTVNLTATPDEGYRFKEWQVLSGDVTVENDQFEMPAQAVEIKAIFELIPAYTLSAPNPVEINPNDVWTAMTFDMPDLNFDLADDNDDRTPHPSGAGGRHADESAGQRQSHTVRHETRARDARLQYQTDRLERRKHAADHVPLYLPERLERGGAGHLHRQHQLSLHMDLRDKPALVR